MTSSRFLQSRWRLLVPALLGAVVFLLISGGEILNPAHIGWLTGGDPAQHFIGWHFFRHAPLLQSPMGANKDFGMEIGSSIVYTDSLPLLAFLFKPFRGILPEPFQYMGMWMLACFILQAVFAWKLIGKFSDDPWVQFFGTGFFTIAPPFLLRMHGHESLMAQWLILVALLLYFGERWAPARWLILLVIASLVHAYLLLMVTSLWVTDQATRILSRGIAWPRAALWGLGSLAALGLVMWQTGYFMLAAGSLEGGGYGYYRMNLLSLFHANGGWSVVFANDFLGPGDDEGFNFLGVGGLVLLVVAIAESLRDSSVWRGFRRFWPIAALAAILTLYAVSNHPALGSTELFTFPMPERIASLTGIFRASGRVFWPVFYLIYLGSMFVVATRFTPRKAAAILGFLFVLQIADCSQALGILHRKLNHQKPWVSSLRSPFWPEAAKRYKKIVYVPPYNVPKNYFDLSYFAASSGMSINVGAFARLDLEKLRRASEEQIQKISAGSFADDSLYVFEQHGTWETALAALRQGDRAGALDGFRILAPKCSQCATCLATGAFGPEGTVERLLAYRFGTKIDFGAAGNGLDYELSGFGLPENWGTWTDGPLARLGLCLVQPVERDLNLVLGSYTYVGGEHQLQEGQVVVNGTKLGTFTYQQAGLVETRALRIPKVVAAARGGEVIVEMLLPNAFSPAEIGKSDDQRKLGLGLVWATIAPTEH